MTAKSCQPFSGFSLKGWHYHLVAGEGGFSINFSRFPSGGLGTCLSGWKVAGAGMRKSRSWQTAVQSQALTFPLHVFDEQNGGFFGIGLHREAGADHIVEAIQQEVGN